MAGPGREQSGQTGQRLDTGHDDTGLESHDRRDYRLGQGQPLLAPRQGLTGPGLLRWLGYLRSSRSQAAMSAALNRPSTATVGSCSTARNSIPDVPVRRSASTRWLARKL